MCIRILSTGAAGVAAPLPHASSAGAAVVCRLTIWPIRPDRALHESIRELRSMEPRNHRIERTRTPPRARARPIDSGVNLDLKVVFWRRADRRGLIRHRPRILTLAHACIEHHAPRRFFDAPGAPRRTEMAPAQPASTDRPGDSG